MEALDKAKESKSNTAAPFVARPKRWDAAFGDEMTEGDVGRVLKFAPFKTFDPERFPSSCSLRDIILNDTRIVAYKPNQIVVREGDYGNSAFIILKGSVRIFMSSLPQDQLGRRSSKKSLIRSIAQIWNRSKVSEALAINATSSNRENVPHKAGGHSELIFLQDAPAVIKDRQNITIGAGEIFGELGALGRTPRTSTIIAAEDSELLEIRWQGLREIRRYAPEWKKHLDQVYRSNSLNTHLLETPLFSHLSREDLKLVADSTEFQSHGTFDWHASYQQLAKADAHERLEHEPVIAGEGNHPNGIYLIRNGFARLSQRYNNGERTDSYLSKGQYYGLAEVAWNYYATQHLKDHAQGIKIIPNKHTLRALGYIDTLFIPTHIIEDHVFKNMSARQLEALFQNLDINSDQRRTHEITNSEIPNDKLEFFVEHRIINGSSAMLIDLERCTRCDDCVRACAAVHDNNPRFIREGKEIDGIMITQACMHCSDPVCMIGCPTGAIHRDLSEGQIVINHNTCIGCSTCANSCPYGNIKMVDIRDARSGEFIIDSVNQQSIQKATKCDLCVDQFGGPACERACPHDAMFRADMSQTKQLARWLNR